MGKTVKLSDTAVSVLDKLRGDKSYSSVVEELIKSSSKKPVVKVYNDTIEEADNTPIFWWQRKKGGE
ncbi:hypothetical protein L6273_00405 [Candidatus Parcubacteria bacterium]|nr:hypothetical protein [Candidatus Parcubacteria bacterium]